MKLQKIQIKFSLQVKRYPLIQANELYENLNIVKVLTSSFVMPPSKQDKMHVYNQQKIGDAQFFDIDQISDKSQDLPHMLPRDNNQFKELIQKFNLNKNDNIVLYDDFGIVGSSRAYWMLNIYGFENVFILNGGLNSWNKQIKDLQQKNFKDERGWRINQQKAEQVEQVEQQDQNLKLKRKWLTTYDQIQEAQYLCKNNLKIEILDARSEDRFLSKVKEPREGVRSGNIQGSKSIPYKILLNQDDTFKSNFELNQIFQEKQIDFTKHIISYCGSGVTACVIYVALELLGQKKKSVYDGSWAEFGSKIQDMSDEGLFQLNQVIQQNLLTAQNSGNSPIKVQLNKGQYSWCTCGRSENQPFCDGMHLGTDFKPKKFFIEQESEVWLCNCKKTQKQPFCDGSHQK